MTEPVRLAKTYRQALALFDAGDFDAAQRLASRLLEKKPEEPAFLALRGSIRGQQGHTREALDNFSAALRCDRNNAGLYFNHGVAARKLGQLELAMQSFERAIELQSDWAEAHFQLGETSRLLNLPDKALAHLERALKSSPDHVPALGALAMLHEKAHRLNRARVAAARALELAPQDVTANLTMAQSDIRSGDLDRAHHRLNDLVKNSELHARNRAYAYGLLGEIYDQQDQYQQAFDAFSTAKQALADHYQEASVGRQSVYDLTSVDRIASFHRNSPVSDWPKYAPAQPWRIAFLVGFPRSGTTLLEQILASHPEIVSIEEQPVLDHAMRATLFTTSDLVKLSKLDAADIEQFRQEYLKRAEHYLPRFDPDSNQLLVDKLPLNTIALALIWRLFPEARIIRAIRDPRAVVFSCFKHNFSANEAMANMLSLESITRYYTAVMTLGNYFEKALPFPQHRIRYEDLIDDFENETRRLLNFLEVPWDPSVLDYRRTARQRNITTPSYSQVVQPLYTRSKQNWAHYSAQLSAVLPALTPFIRDFGYHERSFEPHQPAS